MGIDFGGTSIKAGLCRGARIIARADPIPTQEFEGPGPLLDAIVAAVDGLRSRTASGRVAAVGIGVPGFVDCGTGVVHQLTNVPGWVEIPLSDLLRERTGLPAVAENDANCMTYAEFRHGAGAGARNMVAVTLGTGVGGGLILDGRLFHGSRSGAGEIGQMSIRFDGKPGTYGNTGALEEYVGNREIAARARYLHQREERDVPIEECSPAALAEAAGRGDQVALQVWDEVTTFLACGLANCVWLVNPDVIVVGGGVSQAGDLLFGPLVQKLRGQLAETFRAGLKVVPAAFSNDAGIIGSAAIALDSAGAGC